MDRDDRDLDELIALRMLQLLQEHGWDFTYGRDPVLVLIEYEEIQERIDNGETDE